jgi:hypothetical protein
MIQNPDHGEPKHEWRADLPVILICVIVVGIISAGIFLG